MSHIVREYTNALLGAIEEGLIDPEDALAAALLWMSEDDVKSMCRDNEYHYLMTELSDYEEYEYE